MKKSDLIFVYGTLMSGFEGPCAVFLRKNASLLGEASCSGYLYRVSWYPGLVLSPEALAFGELYKIKESSEVTFWATLDEYEGVDPMLLVGDEYIRQQIDVRMDSKMLTAWTYLFTGPKKGKPIAGGRFYPDKSAL
ncbi:MULTISPECIES: gamma-glutamylcyclotransferase [unclassified Imperialibacter]|uniref:gamma-glutamylcyclotransferase family protein n=1 Tax=unclassified Imperialibacter TaxID=2629706 RepID=UPI0012587509|nr:MULTISPECIES: gamma-glutamylcyclotransferase family protein [unclassified Imperialibacter]CAD5276533.1 conserved hypothetical protein [Imperialibacter sp. 89]CAD5294736.1 conserved hypothetical protein [Imperialibacter sp. 75]VVT26871.1 conserved hypothetical protein [Imperialibacter sp. EC-SDR9]